MSNPEPQSIPLSTLESSAAAAFNNLGDKYLGRVTALKQQQQTNPKDGTPQFFPSGDPKMLWIITLEQSNGDSVALWAKGGRTPDATTGSGESMLSAIGSAVRAAGAEGLEKGGKLAVAFTGEVEPKERGLNATKLYTAQYQPPVPSIPAADLFGDGPAPAQAPQAQAPAPTPQAPADLFAE